MLTNMTFFKLNYLKCFNQRYCVNHLYNTFTFTINVRHCSTNSNVRVRFAPSPTGFLHLGGLRTALYNYLFAKSLNGKFILRIEDTDQTRVVRDASDEILRDLEWLGIQIDEGPHKNLNFGPYLQSQRKHIYNQHLKTLLDNGSAYYCFCTNKRLELLRKEAIRMQAIPKYDNRCRALTKDQIEEKLRNEIPYCIRFKLKPGIQTYNDEVYGQISYDVSLNEGDPVIMKGDGFPTYHFANVVDDHCMEITHVLRGVEWQISTPKHILMYEAFNWTPPKFGHLPLLLNADGTKLSKRQGDVRIEHYRKEGIFPLALINFIVHSGGGFEKDLIQNAKPKSYTIDELCKQFSIHRIKSHSGKIMPERLYEFNRLELKRLLKNEQNEMKLIEDVKELAKRNIDNNAYLDLENHHIKNILKWSVGRISKLSDLFTQDLRFVWTVPTKYYVDKDCIENIKLIVKESSDIEFNREKINVYLKELCQRKNIEYSKFMKTLRLILSGLREGPGVAEMMEILGKENSLKRLELCIKRLQNKIL